MQAIKHILYGAIIGVANVIPGVSGGTMAVVLGIYDQLVGAINLKGLKKNLGFLIPILIGAGAGILLFSKAVKFLYLNYPVPTNFAFIGLILGSIPMIYRRARQQKARPGGIVALLAALAVMVAIALAGDHEFGSAMLTTLTVRNFFWLLAASAIAAFAMILPGISGSFVMLVLGTYASVITAISDLNIPLLIPVAIGCAAGIYFGANLVKLLLDRFPQPTYFAILGLVVGSLTAVYPGFIWGVQGIVSIVLMLLFAGIAYWFSVRA